MQPARDQCCDSKNQALTQKKKKKEKRPVTHTTNFFRAARHQMYSQYFAVIIGK